MKSNVVKLKSENRGILRYHFMHVANCWGILPAAHNHTRHANSRCCLRSTLCASQQYTLIHVNFSCLGCCSEGCYHLPRPDPNYQMFLPCHTWIMEAISRKGKKNKKNHRKYMTSSPYHTLKEYLSRNHPWSNLSATCKRVQLTSPWINISSTDRLIKRTSTYLIYNRCSKLLDMDSIIRLSEICVNFNADSQHICDFFSHPLLLSGNCDNHNHACHSQTAAITKHCEPEPLEL